MAGPVEEQAEDGVDVEWKTLGHLVDVPRVFAVLKSAHSHNSQVGGGMVLRLGGWTRSDVHSLMASD